MRTRQPPGDRRPHDEQDASRHARQHERQPHGLPDFRVELPHPESPAASLTRRHAPLPRAAPLPSFLSKNFYAPLASSDDFIPDLEDDEASEDEEDAPLVVHRPPPAAANPGAANEMPTNIARPARDRGLAEKRPHVGESSLSGPATLAGNAPSESNTASQEGRVSRPSRLRHKPKEWWVLDQKQDGDVNAVLLSAKPTDSSQPGSTAVNTPPAPPRPGVPPTHAQRLDRMEDVMAHERLRRADEIEALRTYFDITIDPAISREIYETSNSHASGTTVIDADCAPPLWAAAVTIHEPPETVPLNPDPGLVFQGVQEFELLVAAAIHLPDPDRTRLLDNLVAAVQSGGAKLSVSDALRGADGAKWKKAIEDEVNGVIELGKYKWVHKPKEARVAFSFIVLSEKKGSARWCIDGSRLVKGVDYIEASSPTSDPTVALIIAALAVHEDMISVQWDVKKAFIVAPRADPIFIKPPKGYESPEVLEGKVLECMRAHYGTNDAPDLFFQFTKGIFTELGYSQSAVQPSTWIKHVHNADGSYRGMAVFPQHVDDFGYRYHPMLGSERELIEEAFKAKGATLKTSELETFLGLQYQHEDGKVYIHQQNFIDALILEFHESLDQYNTPATTDSAFWAEFDSREPATDTDKTFMRQRDGRRLLGMLLWILRTRPDCAFIIRRVAEHAHDLKTIHWVAMQRVLGYLKRTLRLGLCFRKDAPLIMQCYSDADYAEDSSSRKSVSGVLIMLAGAPIVAVSKKQSIVADSSTAAEVIALHSLLRQILWLRIFFTEIHKEQPCLTLHCDNQTVVTNLQNRTGLHRTKHMAVRYSMIRDYMDKGLVSVQHIRTENQLADILTKPLGRHLFEKHRSHLLSEVPILTPRESSFPPPAHAGVSSLDSAGQSLDCGGE